MTGILLTLSSHRLHGVHVLPPRLSFRPGPLRQALTMLATCVALFATVEAFLGAALYPEHAEIIGAYPFLGLAFVLVGTLAWNRRPSNRTGALLCLTGGTVLAAALGNVDEPHVLAFGLLVGQWPIAASLLLVLAFPAGRVTGRVDRSLVVVGFLVTLLLQVPIAFPTVPVLAGFQRLHDALTVGAIAVLLVASARVFARVWGAGRGTNERHVLLAVYAYGIGLLLFFPFSARVLGPWLEIDPFTLFALQIAVFVTAPFVYAAGVLLGGFARTGELTELAAWLGSHESRRTSLRDALAEVLGDPSLEVLFTRPGSGALIDAEGQPAEPAASRTRGVVPVLGADGRTPSASLVYDRTLIADPSVVEQAGRVMSLALERERLDAELLAEREALRASRLRVVEVGDVERRKLAQDLHDMVQSGLTLAALRAGQLTSAATDPRTRNLADLLRSDLDSLITEFRNVVHGVMPALLLERGLPAAAEDLLDRCPVPSALQLNGATDLPPPVATTAYLILAEAVANSVRHASPSRLDVVVDQRGPELRLEIADDGVGGARPPGPDCAASRTASTPSAGASRSAAPATAAPD